MGAAKKKSTPPRTLITAETAWQQQVIAKSEGPHTLTWTYGKGAWGSQGMVCGRVDQ